MQAFTITPVQQWSCVETSTSGIGMFRVVEALGVRVVEVPELRDEVALVRDQGVALIRAGLDADALAWAADWLLPRVIEMQPHSPSR